jgi:hypothetical protein
MVTLRRLQAALPQLVAPLPRSEERHLRSTWKPVGVALLSAVLPGLGHLAIGRLRVGLMFMLATLVAALLIVTMTPRDALDALATFSQPKNLAAVLVVDLALLALRVAAVVDGYRSARAESFAIRQPALATLALCGVLAFTAAPHAVIGYYDFVTWRFLDRVFSSDNSRPAPKPEEVDLTFPVRLKEDAQPVVLPTRVEESE